MSQTISVIQIDAGQLLAIEARQGRGGFELLHFLDLPQPEDGITPEWLKEVWEKGHFETNRVIHVLSPETVNTKTLQLPQLAGEQRAAAMRLEYEAKHELYRMIEEKEVEQGVSVKTANVEAEQLNTTVQCLEAAGLKVLWSGLRFRGVHTFLNFHRDFLDNAENQLYLDVQEELTEIGLVNTSEVLYRRNIALGMSHFQNNASEWADDFLEELRLSLVAASKLVGELPRKMELFGKATAELLPLDRIETELQIQCYLPDKTRLTGTLTGNYTPRLATLIGLALDELNWDPHPELRFQTSDQIRRLAGWHRQIFFWKVSGIFILILFGLALGMRAHTVKTLKDNAWISEHSAGIHHLNQLNQATGRNMAAIDSLEDWLNGREVELEFLRILQVNLPENTLIDDLTIEDQKLKNLSGVTPSVSNLLESFQRIPELKGLQLKGAITNAKDGREQFQMEGTIVVGELKR